jgi:acyl carrier protein
MQYKGLFRTKEKMAMKTVEDILALANDTFKLPANLQHEQSLREQGLDSLDIIMLLHEIEVNFDVQIPQEQTRQLRSLQDIVNFLNTSASSAR